MSQDPPAAPARAAPPGDPVGYLFDLERFGIKLGLDNIRTLVEALDHPDQRFRSILVAGTNGKGSVAAMVERGLRAAGYATGLYTSPHLVDLTERFAVGGRAVDGAALSAEAGCIRKTIETLRRRGRLDRPPTFFEATTALALSLFRRRRVDVAVLEVGMGGRFDATNVVTPVAVAVPSIDLDHQRHLGSTLAAIAFEKAGVIKPGTLVVTGETKPEALGVLRAAARERGARHVDAAVGVTIRCRLRGGATRIDALTTGHGRYGPLTLALNGLHQVRNAAVAVRLLEELARAGIHVPRSAVEQALTDVRWPGRLQLVEPAPDRRVLLDPAHNVAAAAALGDYVSAVFPTGLPFVFGALEDKDVAGMLEAVGRAATRIVCAPIRSRRACPPKDLVAIARAARPDLPVTAAESPQAALAAAWNAHPLAVVSGSAYLVGEVLHEIGNGRRGPEPTAASG